MVHSESSKKTAALSVRKRRSYEDPVSARTSTFNRTGQWADDAMVAFHIE
jgi:hypothetical protein